MSGGWNSDLCGCFTDCKICLFTYLCPCFILGKTAEKIGDNKWHACIGYLIPLLGLYCAYSVRQKVVEQKGIDESGFTGILLILCCGFCALNQMARETGVEGLSMARE